MLLRKEVAPRWQHQQDVLVPEWRENRRFASSALKNLIQLLLSSLDIQDILTVCVYVKLMLFLVHGLSTGHSGLVF